MNIHLSNLIESIKDLSLSEKVSIINEINKAISDISPFKEHPVSSIQWTLANDIVMNSYNPNTVASPEMKLLATSLLLDGFTQPVVITKEGPELIQVDGYHRTSLVRENSEVSFKSHGYVPAVFTKNSNQEDRMASTVRHNRARGKHSIEIMSRIIQDLVRRGWSNEKIGIEFGMEPDEILRLKQTLGLAELYSSGDYSFAWEPVDEKTV